MVRYSAPADLKALLLQRCEKVQKNRHTVLFKRGELSFGMFLVLRGAVSLNFGVDGSSPGTRPMVLVLWSAYPQVSQGAITA